MLHIVQYNWGHQYSNEYTPGLLNVISVFCQSMNQHHPYSRSEWKCDTLANIPTVSKLSAATHNMLITEPFCCSTINDLLDI